MDVRHAWHPDTVRTMDTEALRENFLVTGLFRPGEIALTYSHYDRFILGGAMPADRPLVLETFKPIGQKTFLAMRELGALNIGGPGRIVVDGNEHALQPLDCLYVGKGAVDVRFESDDSSIPAKFYLTSTPAHASFPTRFIAKADARHQTVGDQATANRRDIYQFIHPEVCDACQLSLGFTALQTGSIWNTMPSHTHDRRMEVYLYFDLPEDQRVFHFMGEPTQTRHLLVGSEEAVISPPWSIHSGAGTSRYTFIWAMGGENRDFTDMDHLAMSDLR